MFELPREYSFYHNNGHVTKISCQPEDLAEAVRFFELSNNSQIFKIVEN